MNGPLWGAHPHFAQFGLDRRFSDMLGRCGDAIDLVEVSFEGPASHRCYAKRHPDLTRPDNIPAGTTWIADPHRRRALVTMDEADPDHAVRDAIAHLVAALPYRDHGDDWPYGVPSLELRRDGASMSLPCRCGTLAIYTEGREKSLAPGAPFWISRVSVFSRATYPDSDILAAGGVAEHLLQELLGDERVATPEDIRPLGDARVGNGMTTLDLPLDTFVRNRENTE